MKTLYNAGKVITRMMKYFQQKYISQPFAMEFYTASTAANAFTNTITTITNLYVYMFV